MRAAGLPSFSIVSGSWSGLVGEGCWSGGDRRRYPVTEHLVPQRLPGMGPGPVAGQMQHSAALRPGDPGGHGDDLTAQCRAAGHGMGWAGLARVPAARSKLWLIAAQIAQALVRGEPAGGQVREGSVDQIGEGGLRRSRAADG